MRKNTKGKLDRELGKEQVRKFIGLSFVGAGFLLFLLLLLPFFPQTEKNIQGNAFQLSAVLTEEGNSPIMLVKLDNGKIVRAQMTKKIIFKKGARVELRMKESITGITSYNVLRYTAPFI